MADRLPSVAPGDVVRMKKTHPCGSDTWLVVRVGADIGIRCLTCERQVMMPRSIFERRIKAVVSRSTAGDTGIAL